MDNDDILCFAADKLKGICVILSCMSVDSSTGTTNKETVNIVSDKKSAIRSSGSSGGGGYSGGSSSSSSMSSGGYAQGGAVRSNTTAGKYTGKK